MHRQRRIGVKVLGCILLFFWGCSGRTSQSGVPPSQPSSSRPPAERSVPMVGKKEAGKTTSQPQSYEERPISIDPLFGIPTQRIFPMDFDLGVLKPVDPVVQDAVRVVEEFFARIQRDRNWNELLHPEYRWFLEEDLKPWEGIPFREFRLGAVLESSSNLIEIPFRILKEKKSFAGSILLEKREEHWYIADFSVEGNESVEKQARERFDPFLETRAEKE